MYLTVCVTCKLFFRILQINTPNTEAFDRVWHDGLLHELHTMSATRPHSSSKNHLIIKQNLQIKISDHTSTEIMIEAGVPQGSRLSSLLYSHCIINYLPTTPHVSTSLHLYSLTIQCFIPATHPLEHRNNLSAKTSNHNN